MRAGGSCSLQQALTPEAAGLIKQALTLAKRRGHGQVTPLHVAATMLTISSGLLRSACLRSHSHPLQCKALELCFNVALNRLPAASSGPMFGIHGMGNSHHHQHHVPSISNALIAAFKRAQAHQRRGSVENNQSLQAVKIELDQLVISILDDPSVSRVMREAGFSSSQVKSNVERVVSSEKSPTSPASAHNTVNITPIDTHTPCRLPPMENESKQFHSNMPSLVNEKDVIQVMEHLMDKRRKSIVIVGESMKTIEGAVRGLIDKTRDGSSSVDDVARTLRGVKFINLSLPSFENLRKEAVEHRLLDLRVHLRRNDTVMSKSKDCDGVILFLGDLKWIAENRGTPEVELLVAELGKLICTSIEDEKFWVMGTATLQSYMRCKSGYPSLESTWRLYPVAVPAGSLSFGLSTADSDVGIGCHYSVKIGESGSSMSSPDGRLQPLGLGNLRQSDEGLTCCVDCHTEFEKEAQNSRNSSANGSTSTSTSSLPPWLQHYRDEQNGVSSHSTDDRESARNALLKKWNKICNSLHGNCRSSERSLKFSSLPPSPSISGFSCELINHYSRPADRTNTGIITTGWGMDLNPYLSHSTSSLPNSGSSSDDIMEIEPLQKFKELNPKNIKILIDELEQCIPWQKQLVPDIVNTILRCRSSTMRRSSNETWFLFEGADKEGKQKMAIELARLMFGSYDSLVNISSSSLGSQGSKDTERSCTFFDEFSEAVSDNPHRVFFIKDIEVSEHNSQAQLMKAIETGNLDKHYGHEVDARDAIIILSRCKTQQMSRSREQSPIKPIPGHEDEDDKNPSLSLDLNISIAPNKNSFELRGYVDKVVVFDVQEL